MIIRRIITYIAALLTLCGGAGCVKSGPVPDEFTEVVYQPAYASGFRILRVPGHESTLIEVCNPWQGADSVRKMIFMARGGEVPPAGVMAVNGSAGRVVCMSTSQIGLLDLFGAADKVVGVGGLDYVSNPTVSSRRDSVADVGYDGAVDYERLIASRPDLVLLFGVNGASAMEKKLDEFAVPYAYIGEYLENTPLARAEWAVALGELTGCRDKAEAAFRPVAMAYDSIAAACLAGRVGAQSPRVMLNAPYSDVWFMPSSDSYMVRLIADAGGSYIYTGNSSGISMPVDIEEAARLVGAADIWLQPGQAQTLDQLRLMVPKIRFDGPVFNSVPDFWESGVARPDLVLDDLSRIMRGDSALTTYFYRLK